MSNNQRTSVSRPESKRIYERSEIGKAKRRARDMRYIKTAKGVGRSLRKYGITLEEFNQIFDKQGGKCANPACSIKLFRHAEENIKRSFIAHVDHRHKPHQVRGLLCGYCNSAIGNARENPEILEGLVIYMKEWQEKLTASNIPFEKEVYKSHVVEVKIKEEITLESFFE